MNIRISYERARGCGYRKVDYAYLAGLIDGDGCILIRRRDKKATTADRQRGRSFIILVKIGGETAHLSGLLKFHKIGTIYVRQRNGLRNLAEWTIAGNQARSLLKAVKPFLRLKQKQAEVALLMPQPRSRWAVTDSLRSRQENCQTQISNLNQLGRGRK